MKNNGFTLVELLAILAIMGFIALITMPIVLKQIKDTKEDLFNNQIELIKSGAISYVTDVIAHPNSSDTFNNSINMLVKDNKVNSTINVPLYILQNNGALERDIVNPICDEDSGNKYFSPDNILISITYDGAEFEYDVKTNDGTAVKDSCTPGIE